MKNDVFTFKNNKLLCWRLGNINAVKQAHFNKDVKTGRMAGTHKPPISRGVWAFPYPHYDLFFCWHKYEQMLPKKMSDEYYDSICDKMTDEDAEIWWREREKKLRKILKILRPSKFYSGEFYSHVFPNGKTDYDDWFFWDSPKDWAKVVRKTIFVYERWNDELIKMNFSVDHLEIFVPNPS